jgi:hypothetical protein
MSLKLIPLAARLASGNNKTNCRWLVRHYKKHVTIYDSGIVRYERLFQKLEIVPADFLHRRCGVPMVEMQSEKTWWLHEPYKIQSRSCLPLFGQYYYNTLAHIYVSRFEIEQHAKLFCFGELAAYIGMMCYLLEIKNKN